MSLWLSPKNRIQANLALWLVAGTARESGRRIIGAQILAYLPTSCIYVTLRNRMTPAWGEQQERVEETQVVRRRKRKEKEVLRVGWHDDFSSSEICLSTSLD